MQRALDAENGPLHAARPGKSALLAAAALVASCGSRSHIEPTLPTPAPATAAVTPSATPAALPSSETMPATSAEVPTRPVTAAKCAPESSALSRLCCELTTALSTRAQGTVFAAGPLAGSAAKAREADLSTHIAGCMAHAAGRGARPLGGAPSLEQARAAAAEARTLVYAAPELAQGRLRVSAAAYELAKGRAAAGSALPVARADASAELDGEIGAHLPRIAIAASRIERDAASTDIVALACGDVAGGGLTEIVAVGRHKVQIGRTGDGRFSVRVEASWASLSPVAPSPLREPIGGAVIARGSGVLAGISDRAEGFLLSPALAKVRALGAPVPLGDEFGCVGRAGFALGTPKACEPRGKHLDESAPIDAFASGAVVDAEGHRSSVLATRDASTRRVTLRQGTNTATLPELGSALAVADLDLDGQPELLASVDTGAPDEDAIVISTWLRDGTVAERLRIPVKDGVRALAVCPAEDVRMAPIVAATASGLWVIR